MPKNTYFTQGSITEQGLYEELVIEAMGIYGTDVYYLPRKIISQDDITNEVIESQFNETHLIEMYIESAEGFEGDGTLLSKFGLEIRDQINLVVARKTFGQTMQESQEERIRPTEGDLIYLPLTKSLFEIKFVEHEQPFYQLKNVPVFKLNCETYEYRGEEIDTGIVQVDAIQSIHASTTSVGVKLLGTGDQPDTLLTGGDELSNSDFLLGETLLATFPDGSTANTELLGWNDSVSPIIFNLGSLSYTSTTGRIPKLEVGTTLTGLNSGATAEIIKEEDLTSELYDNDPDNDAADFEALNSNYLDFSEFNPFGEPNA